MCVREFSISVCGQRLLLIGKCDNRAREDIDLQSYSDRFNSSSFQVCVYVWVCVSVYWSAAVHSQSCSEEYHSVTLSVFASFSLWHLLYHRHCPSLWFLPFLLSWLLLPPPPPSLYRIVRNLGMVWSVICCLAVLFHCRFHQALFSSCWDKHTNEGAGLFSFLTDFFFTLLCAIYCILHTVYQVV